MTQQVPAIQIWDYPEPKTRTEQRQQIIEGICDRFPHLAPEQQRALLKQAMESNCTGSLFELMALIPGSKSNR